MSLNRREFFQLAAAGATAIASGSAQASTEEFAPDCKEAYGVLVDTVVCIGCRRCEWACKNQHNLPKLELAAYDDKAVFAMRRRPDDQSFTVVNTYPGDNGKQLTMKVQCMHCNRPACASACIVGALQKRENGPVHYNAWKCIGCRYCMVACPFQIPAYEYSRPLDPKVMKCTFCDSRIEEGKKPACVTICPNEALTFGTRQELIEVAYTRISRNPDKYVKHVYGENEIGGTSWMYLAGADFAKTELPKLPGHPIPEVTESIQHGIFKSFVPPLALYGLLGLIMYSVRQGNDEVKEGEKK